MRVLPLPPGTRTPAPAPSTVSAFPWRFVLGETVYLLGHPDLATFEVIGGELYSSFPHLIVRDEFQTVWRVPQLHASSRPISATHRR